MSSSTATPSTTEATAAVTPISGYYAVRKGKGGLRDAIFVSWERAKEYVDVPKDSGEVIEFSFFAKMQDAVHYIHPTAKSYADIAEQATAEAGAASDQGEEDKDAKEEEASSKRKRPELEGKPLKKIKIPDQDEDDKDGDTAAAKESGGSSSNPKSDSDKTSMNENKEEAKSDKDADEPSGDKGDKDEAKSTETDDKMETDETEEEVIAAVVAGGDPEPKDASKTQDTAPATSAGPPLNLILEQGFQQNLPKGWRSQHLDLYLNRRDHFKEPALKQYLQDLKDLQNYRESYTQPPRSEEKHISGASHPISVSYLNWAWGVSNSYHRDIRRQQKKSQSEGVELPHFKAHSKGEPNNYNPKPTKKPSPTSPKEDKDNDGKQGDEEKAKPPVSGEPTKPKTIPEILEDAYTNFRHRGWRARDILPKPKETCDDEDEAQIHKNYIQQLKTSHYSKELKKLTTFRESNPLELQRFTGRTATATSTPATQHPSGIVSPFELEYLQYAWDINDEDIATIEKEEAAKAAATGTEVPRPSRRTLPTQAATTTQGAGTGTAKPATEAVPSSATAATVEADKVDSHNFDGTEEDDTPKLIESLRSSWFKGKDKGWRSVEMGLIVDPRSKTLTMGARKKREQLYVVDLEVLKQWWKTYPSSQHYVFTVPEKDGDVDDESYRNMSYAASSKPNGTLARTDQKRHKSGINAPWSLTYLNWSWGVSNSYNRDLVRKEKRKQQYQQAVKLSKEQEQQVEQNQATLYI